MTDEIRSIEASMIEQEERIAGIPAKVAAMREKEREELSREEAAGRLVKVAAGEPRPSDGLQRMLWPLQQALERTWERYVALVGPKAWVLSEEREDCTCAYLAVTSPGRLACAVKDGCRQSFDFADAATNRRYKLSSAEDAYARARRRMTMWAHCSSPRAIQVAGFDAGQGPDGARLYVEIEVARPWVVVGYRWLMPLGVMSADADAPKEDAPKKTEPRPTYQQIMTEPTVTGERGGSPFPPSVHRQQAAVPKDKRRRR